MTLKLAVILLAVALLATMVARARAARPKPPTRAVEAAKKCPTCGAWVMQGATCGCKAP